MASVITFNLLPGEDIVLQISEIYDNILTVVNKPNQLKGLLMPFSTKNDIILDKLLMECKELNDINFDNDNKMHSSLCIADSTLSHNFVEITCNNNKDNSVCVHCKDSMKKVPKMVKRPTTNREVLKLTKHGFNENILKMKDDSPRRGTFRGTYRLTSERMTIKIEKAIKKEENYSKKVTENDVTLNISHPKIIKKLKDKRELKVIARATSERALKTRANEKIIDLCTKRKSVKLSNLKKFLDVETEVKKPKLCTPIISDTSIYDFVDEDCVSEPIKKVRCRFLPLKSPRRQKNNIAIKQHTSEVVRPNSVVSTYHEYKGIKFSVNDVVWAKIPGYPFWPAHIDSFDNFSLSKTNVKRCRINWIGWDQTSFLPLKSLLHFKENFINKYSSKLKSIKYKTAIELACKELELDLEVMVAEVAKKASEKNSASFSGSRKKSINLDEIFNCRIENTQNLSQLQVSQETCLEDEDTDEEEKARSALITAESLEANSKLNGLISKVV